ncbi:MAG: thiamine pyrophosphate-dependent enzyme [Dehalococcoidales bacterium]|nr:thiamine pyrophosphate-dependent enzyme [Dehalococcoidales bacterium]
MKQAAKPRRTGRSDVAPDVLLGMYRSMLRLRKFEEAIAERLKTPSEIVCPVHLYTGEEAVAVGVCANLRKEDFVFSTHRSHGHYLAKGGDMKSLAAELYGKTTGCSHGRGGSMHLAAPEYGLPGSSAIVAGTIPLAVGAALAFSVRKEDNVAVAFFGDGAANEGVFYESLNLAALRKLPVIFICENNLYSTHMPVASCLASTEIYRKAESFCMPGVRIDGNNVLKVFREAGRAIAAARLGEGPALIECLTYRWRGHVGPNYDLDKGLRSKEELDSWMTRCPIKNFEEFLAAQGLISTAEKEAVSREVDVEVAEAIAFARASPYPDSAEITRGVFR